MSRDRARERETVLHALRLMYPRGMLLGDMQRLLFPVRGSYATRAAICRLLVPLLNDELIRLDTDAERYYARPPLGGDTE